MDLGRFVAGDLVASRVISRLEDRRSGHDPTELRRAVAILERERDVARQQLAEAAALLGLAAEQLAWSEIFDDEKSDTIREINAYLDRLGGQP